MEVFRAVVPIWISKNSQRRKYSKKKQSALAERRASTSFFAVAAMRSEASVQSGAESRRSLWEVYRYS
jgi:hypothetical protein